MKLEVSLSVQEEADYYVVLVGSSLHHVTKAHRAEDQGSVKFTVPGETLSKSQSVIDVYRAMIFFEFEKACKTITITIFFGKMIPMLLLL